MDEVASFLKELLGRRLVAHVAEVDDKAVARQKSEQRLCTAYEIAQLLVRVGSPRIVRERS